MIDRFLDRRRDLPVVLAVNKQLNDKERVAAAVENGRLLDIVNKCLAGLIVAST